MKPQYGGGSIGDTIYDITDTIYDNLLSIFKYLQTHKIITLNIILFVTYISLFYYFLFKKKSIFFDKYNHYTQFIGIVLAIVWIYSILYKVYIPSTSVTKSGIDMMKNIVIISVSIGILFGILYLLTSSFRFSNFISIMINIVILLGLLFVLFKLINNTRFIRKMKQNKVFSLIYHYIFLIPCILFDWSTNVYDDVSNTPTFVFKIFFLLSTFIALYILYPIIAYKLYTHDSSLLLDNPVYTDQERVIGTFENLKHGSPLTSTMKIYPNYHNTLSSSIKTNQILKVGDYSLGIGYSSSNNNSTSSNNLSNNSSSKTLYKYYYCLSSWIFIDNQGQNRNEKSTKYTNILSYGDKPRIEYNTSSNTLQVVMKKDMNDYKVIYKTNTLPLQRWNNIVINYDHGNCDVFINNELVASEKGIVSYMSLDSVTVGEDGGVSGGICNVMYYPYVISREKMGWFYHFFKNKTPPVLIKK